MAAQVQDEWDEESRGARADGVGPPGGGAGPPGLRVVSDEGDAREVVREALLLLGLGEELADLWLEAMASQAIHEGGAHPSVADARDGLAVVTGMVTMARARCTVDATVLVCVQDLVLRTGERLLADRGAEDADALSRTGHRSWRSEVKASVAGELQVALGVGIAEARQLVAVATLPGGVRGPVLGALRRGEVHWALVRRFQSRTARLEVEDTTRVAQVLFGTDPEVAAPERLDPDGVLSSRPWHHAEYYAALDREVARYRDEDEKAAQKRRELAHSTRGTRLDVDEDGTASLTVTGSLATMVALSGRLDGMARRCRKAGDTRTLDQLRADIVAMLLLFGTVALPGPDEDDPDAIITPGDVEALRSVIDATPAGEVELVVPWDALLGRVVCPRCDGRTVVPDDAEGGADHSQHAAEGEHHHGERSRGGRSHGGHSHGGHSHGERVDERDHADRDDPPPRQVGELRGFPAGWVSPAEARQIALRPGSTFYRLLTDAADGRCTERTIARYAPDADMRRQIRAADVYGRGPGCRRPANACELDHEHERADGGRTAETNLNAKSRVDHFRKTRKLWRTVMTPRRDITWTTLLGQVARTRGHDYRQYADAFDRLAPVPDHRVSEVGVADLAARRDLANQVLYAAIVSRGPGERAQAEDDVPGSEDWLGLGDWRTVTHRDEDGMRRPGPPVRPTPPEEVLGLTIVTIDDDPSGSWSEQEQDRPDDSPPPF